IQLEVVKDTYVMKIKVNGTDPKIVSTIANAMAFELGTRIEIADRSNEIVEAKKKILELERSLAITEKIYEETKKQLEQTPEKIVTKQALANQPLLDTLIINSNSISNEQLGAIQLETEEVN